MSMPKLIPGFRRPPAVPEPRVRLDNRPEGRAAWLKEQTGKLVGLAFSVVELDLRSYF
jgi:hypothetical protein